MHLLVLSAFRLHDARFSRLGLPRLNAPFGAQCFPTRDDRLRMGPREVSMHLLVLSAFRPEKPIDNGGILMSQCTFWCSVLSDALGLFLLVAASMVSMHLLVLSAFRLIQPHALTMYRPWSQCTFWCSVLSDWQSKTLASLLLSCLNAPFGAQCFPTVEHKQQ